MPLTLISPIFSLSLFFFLPIFPYCFRTIRLTLCYSTFFLLIFFLPNIKIVSMMIMMMMMIIIIVVITIIFSSLLINAAPATTTTTITNNTKKGPKIKLALSTLPHCMNNNHYYQPADDECRTHTSEPINSLFFH